MTTSGRGLPLGIVAVKQPLNRLADFATVGLPAYSRMSQSGQEQALATPKRPAAERLVSATHETFARAGSVALARPLLTSAVSRERAFGDDCFERSGISLRDTGPPPGDPAISGS